MEASMGQCLALSGGRAYRGERKGSSGVGLFRLCPLNYAGLIPHRRLSWFTSLATISRLLPDARRLYWPGRCTREHAEVVYPRPDVTLISPRRIVVLMVSL